MIWQTWRQHRAEATVAAAILAALTTALLVVGTTARHRAGGLGLPACLSANADCGSALGALHKDFHSIPPFIGALIAMPILAGMFWAAPLVSREYEQGTHRLAWTQSVSPLRWFALKITLVFGVLTTATLGLGMLATWTVAPLLPAFGGRFNSVWYDTQGLVLATCVVFALAVGVAASALIRRTIPAMAVTLAAYAAARIPVHFFRIHFAPLATKTAGIPLTALLDRSDGRAYDFAVDGAVGPNDDLAGITMTDPSGHVVSSTTSSLDVLHRYCTGGLPNDPANAVACRSKIQGLSLHEAISYQPSSHFWISQAVESVIFLALAAALVTVAVLALTRRRPN